MIWKEKEIKTVQDLTEAVESCQTPEEAKQFMALYQAENAHAKSNVGYVAGYLSKEKMVQVWEWFDCEHPIFGRRADMSFEELLEAGQKFAAHRNANK